MSSNNKFDSAGIIKFFDSSSHGCFSFSTVATEKGKTFRIENDKKILITKIRVDNCLIKSNQNKCDFIFVIEEVQRVIFVELKSEDINHAFTQIVKTIEYFGNFVALEKNQIEGCIVSSSVPRLANLKFQALVAKFKKSYGINLSKHTNQCIRQL